MLLSLSYDIFIVFFYPGLIVKYTNTFCPMMDHICEVCQEYLATHTITVYSATRAQDHYLCDEHYQEMENPRRFLSLLDYPVDTDQSILKEIYPD